MSRDRISGLPDRLIHRVFAFLDMKQVLRTTLLSTRWRYLWVSNPYLNFQLADSPDDDGDDRDDSDSDALEVSNYESDDNFKNFVDRTLLCRDISTIHKFYLQCSGLLCDGVSLPYQVDTWVTSAIRRNVEVVKLHSVEITHLTLKTLVAQVKSLTLISVVFEQESKNSEILLSSPIMESLILDKCDYNDHKKLTICSPKLRYLMVNVVASDGRYSWSDNFEPCCIKLCAQNLTVLHLKGCMCRGYLLENLSSLVSAEIDLDFVPVEEKPARQLSAVLVGLVSVKSLTLSASPFQVFPEVPDVFNTVLIFEDLRCLKLTGWCNTDYICVIPKLLEKFPYVEALIVAKNEVMSDYPDWVAPALDVADFDDSDSDNDNGGDWELQLCPPCSLLHLKSIEFRNPEACENEFKFLEYVMKNAVSLENVVMTARSLQLIKKEKLLQFCEKLQAVPKSSSNVTILLKERNVVIKQI